MLWRRRPDSNRCMEVLQTSALPLGYGAPHSRSYHGHPRVVNESRHGRDFVTELGDSAALDGTGPARNSAAMAEAPTTLFAHLHQHTYTR